MAAANPPRPAPTIAMRRALPILCSGNWNRLGTLSIGFDPETTGGGRDLGTLLVDGGRELTGISGPDELAVRLQPRHNGGVAGNRLDIRRDPVAKLLAHVG